MATIRQLMARYGICHGTMRAHLRMRRFPNAKKIIGKEGRAEWFIPANDVARFDRSFRRGPAGRMIFRKPRRIGVSR